jgi:hypothetical protein
MPRTAVPLVMTGRVAWVNSDVVTVIPVVAVVRGQLLLLLLLLSLQNRWFHHCC